MDIKVELEAIRSRIIEQINYEFDCLIERASAGDILNFSPHMSHETEFPLAMGAGFFKGKKPAKLIFEGEAPIGVMTWKQVSKLVLERCAAEDENKEKLKNLCGNISGKKRMLLSSVGEGMRSPIKIDDDLYMETHYDTETLLNVLTKRILDAIDYDYSRITVILKAN